MAIDAAPNSPKMELTERDRLLAKGADLDVEIQLIYLDLSRPNPTESGYTEDELRRRLDELLDKKIDIEKALVELAHKEKQAENEGFEFSGNG